MNVDATELDGVKVCLLDLLKRPEKDKVRLVSVPFKPITAHAFVQLADARHHG